MTEDADVKLERLLGYLEHDRDNPMLAADCAEAALGAGRPDLALDVLAPFEAAAALDERARNLIGIAAMRAGELGKAEAQFASLLAGAPDDAGLRFNLAWTLALAKRHGDAREILGDVGDTDLPQAAMLDLQLHHHLAELDEAEAKLDRYLARFPDYPPLQAAAALLAMDLERPDLARTCALKAGEHPDALATLGALELGEHRPGDARDLFTRALAAREANPRAHIGLGLVALAERDPRTALPALDRGAAQFGSHLGSWIAAGWAHFLAGDPATARTRFETALGIDANFGEAQGSLAAMHAFAGEFDEARRRLELAQRLDRHSFSAALTAAVVAAADGDRERAGRIMAIALRQPLGEGSGTLADALTRLAL